MDVILTVQKSNESKIVLGIRLHVLRLNKDGRKRLHTDSVFVDLGLGLPS